MVKAVPRGAKQLLAQARGTAKPARSETGKGLQVGLVIFMVNERSRRVLGGEQPDFITGRSEVVGQRARGFGWTAMAFLETGHDVDEVAHLLTGGEGETALPSGWSRAS